MHLRLLLVLPVLLAGWSRASAPVTGAQEPAPQASSRVKTTLVRVVDGDTFHVLRDQKLEKLRLLGVDTEEVRDNGPGSKPATDLGRAASAHMKELLRCDQNGQPRADNETAIIELEFEGRTEERDTYGRLLCYAWFEARNLNVYLVETGFSPYFTKYGYSSIHHSQFVSAQQSAQAAQRGIWGARDAADGAREYGAMLRWWNARADALETARAALAAGNWIDVRLSERVREVASDIKSRTVFGAAMAVRISRDQIEIELEATTGLSCTVVCRDANLDEASWLKLIRHAREGEANYLTAEGMIRVRDKTARVECASLSAIKLLGRSR